MRLAHPGNWNDLRHQRGTSTILLVDDEPLVRLLLRTLLHHFGYGVIEAPDGRTALQTARQSRFDMLVTDFQMPGMNGFQLGEHLTEDRPAMPVLVLYGASPELLPLAEISRRHWEYLPKPVQRDQLLRTLDANCLGWSLRHPERTNSPAPGSRPTGSRQESSQQGGCTQANGLLYRFA